MSQEDDAPATEDGPYLLPRYLRFARTLALVSGATIGVAAGVSVISSSGCSSTCNGICGEVMGVRPNIAGASGFMGTVGIGGSGGFMGVRPPDSDASDVTPETDAGATDAIVDAGSDDTGGGPRPAPLLPRAWIG